MFYVTDFDHQYDFGMKRIKDFIKGCEKVTEKKDINVGYFNDSLVFELPLPGFKKENIEVKYSGNVIHVKATYENEDITYALVGFKHDNVSKKLYLMNEYIGGAVRWQFVNGLLTIVVSQYTDPNDTIDPVGDNENLFETDNTEEPEPNNP